MPGQNPAITDYPRKVTPAVLRWVRPGWAWTATSNSSILVNGRIIYQPIFVEENTTYIRVAAHVTTLKAGGTIDVRLFADNKGVPGALISSYGTLPLDNAVTVEIVISEELDRGYYWLAYRCPDAASAGAQFSGCAASGGRPPMTGYSAAPNLAGYSLSHVISAYADPAPAPTDPQAVTECILAYREN